MSKEHIAITAGTLRELFAATLSSAQQFAFLELEQYAREIGQELQTKGLVHANAVIETLRAQIAHLKEANTGSDPEIAVGSWWVSSDGEYTQVKSITRTCRNRKCLSNVKVTRPMEQFIQEFTPCDPPEWYEADREGDGQ